MSDHILMQEFEKAELIEVAEELYIKVPKNARAVEILSKIRESLRDEGIPAEEDCSELMDEFLFVAGYIDDDGEVIDAELEGGELGNVVDSERIVDGDEMIMHTEMGDGLMERETTFIVDGNEVKKPPCYGFADERDPACRRCRVLEYCKKERLASRPPCYGKLFLATDENCVDCLEASTCKVITLESISKN